MLFLILFLISQDCNSRRNGKRNENKFRRNTGDCRNPQRRLYKDNLQGDVDPTQANCISFPDLSLEAKEIIQTQIAKEILQTKKWTSEAKPTILQFIQKWLLTGFRISVAQKHTDKIVRIKAPDVSMLKYLIVHKLISGGEQRQAW